MSSYSFKSPLEPNTSESFEQPKGLSTATMIATILMLVFGLSGLMGIIGLLASLASLANAPAPGVNPPPGLKLNAIQIAISVFDLLISIPLVVLSIMVLQRKRFAAVYLSWLALALALLTIPRGILTYIMAPQIIESIKSGIDQKEISQQTRSSPQESQFNPFAHDEKLDWGLRILIAALLSGLILLGWILLS